MAGEFNALLQGRNLQEGWHGWDIVVNEGADRIAGAINGKQPGDEVAGEFQALTGGTYMAEGQALPAAQWNEMADLLAAAIGPVVPPSAKDLIIGMAPQHYWAFDETAGATAADSGTATAVPGVIQPGVGFSTDSFPGGGGQSFSFDGGTGRVDVDGVLTDPSVLSILCAYKITQTPLSTTQIMFAHRDEANKLIVLIMDVSGPLLRFFARDSAAVLVTVDAPVAEVENQWIVASAVLDNPNNLAALRYNNQAEVSVATAFTGDFSAANQTIGAQTSDAAASYTSFQEGLIAHVALFDRVLTTAEHNQIYAKLITP